jgi:hypothetical protein
MAYFPDLAPCTYFGAEHGDKLVAVGWLDAEHPYAQGTVTTDFFDKLTDLFTDHWSPMYLLGHDECPFCDLDTYCVVYKEKRIGVGSKNLFIPAEGFLYVMPSLALHYILAHGYAPPPEFGEAVLRCPPMRSQEYFRKFAENAPEPYAAFAQKRLTTV